MSDATSPAFDLNGKYLYFIESTDDGPSNAGIDLSSLDRAVTSAPYVVVLAKDGASPIPPESDDEKVKDEKKDRRQISRRPEEGRQGRQALEDDKSPKKDEAKEAEKEKDKETSKDPGTEKDKPVEVTVDLDGIGDRILSLPIPPRNYGSILTGKAGVVYLAEGSPVGRSSDESGGPGIRAIWLSLSRSASLKPCSATSTASPSPPTGQRFFTLARTDGPSPPPTT
jgi:tricorn protease